MKSDVRKKPFSCKSCEVYFTRKCAFIQHQKKKHSHRPVIYQCVSCGRVYEKWQDLVTHQQSHPLPNIFVKDQQALEGTACRFEFDASAVKENDLFKIIREIYGKLLQFLKLKLGTGHHQVGIVVTASLGKVDQEGNIIRCLEWPFRGRSFFTLVDNNLFAAFASISKEIEAFQEDGCRWKVERILSIRLELGQCKPLNGSCNLPSVLLPYHLDQTKISKKEMPTNDCFYRAVATHFLKKGENVNTFMERSIIKLHSEDLPVAVQEIGKFERINPKLSLKINVLYMEGDDIYPIRISSNEKGKNRMTLILYKCLFNNGKVTNHYSLVPDLEKFLRKCYRNEAGKKCYQTCSPCPNCLQILTRPKIFQQHLEHCLKNEPQAIRFPKKAGCISFRGFAQKYKSHFVAFLNLQTCSKRSETSCRECNPNTKCPHQNQTSEDQVGISYSFVVLNYNYEIIVQHHYVGDNCVDDLQKTLVQAQEKVTKIIENLSHEPLTESEERQFKKATTCIICEKKFKVENDVGVGGSDDSNDSDSFVGDTIVRDRCGQTGKFLGAAHNKCNRNKPRAQVVPTFCHNFSDQVSHLILKNFKFNEHYKKIEGIGQNTEKIGNLKMLDFIFLDSSELLPGSLDEVVDELVKSKAKTFVLNQMGFSKNQKKQKLLQRQIVFPPSLAISIERLIEIKEIPEREHFVDPHSKTILSNEDYLHTKRVFEEFECSNLMDLFTLQMKQHIALFADAFIHFREMLYENFELDICRYFSFSSFAFDCMLKMTKVEIEHIQDIDMYLMLTQNFRTNFSLVSTRLETSKTQSKTMEVDSEQIQSRKKQNNLICIEANNLYGQAQSRMLPIGQYSFLKDEEIAMLNLEHLDENDKYGYILEVDLEYPSDLHQKHGSFPLAPESETITPDMLSPYQLECGSFLHVEHKQSNKLIASFNERKKYVVHYVTLKLYLNLGLKLGKIHRVIKFRQAKFMKPFVDFCTQLRQQSKSDFRKHLFKLMSHCVLENMLENRPKDLRLVFAQTKQELLKYTNHPRFLNFVIIAPDLVAVYMKPRSLVAKAAYAVGFSISEYSKEFMYRTFYHHISKAFDDKCKVLMSDTESLFISTPFSLDPFAKIVDILDTSNFDSNHPLASLINHFSVECFKSATGSKQICHLLALRSKCYAFETEESDNEFESHQESGNVPALSPMSNMQKHLRNLCSELTEQSSVKGTFPLLQIVRQRKLAHSCCDDKRYVLPCGIHTLPYGSREILLNAIECPFCF